MSNGVDFAPAAGATGAIRYLRSCAHFWMSAVLLGSAFSMHFEYFWNCAGLGLEPEPPEPPEEPEPPEPPDEPPELEPPPRPPSAPCSSEIGFGFGGAVTVCGSPTLERSSENVMLPPSAPWNCERWLSGIWKSSETFRRRSVSSSLPT